MRVIPSPMQANDNTMFQPGDHTNMLQSHVPLTKSTTTDALCNAGTSTDTDGQTNALGKRPSGLTRSELSLTYLLNRAEIATTSYLPSEAHGTLIIAQRSGAKVIRGILASLQASPHNISLQESACMALAKWARDEFYRVVIASSGGIPIILNIMQKHSDHAGIQSQAILALGNLSIDNLSNKLAINALDGIKTIIDTMQSHPKSPEVQASACFALKKLASTTPCNLQQMKTDKARSLLEACVKRDPPCNLQQMKTDKANLQQMKTDKARSLLEACVKRDRPSGEGFSEGEQLNRIKR